MANYEWLPDEQEDALDQIRAERDQQYFDVDVLPPEPEWPPEPEQKEGARGVRGE